MAAAHSGVNHGWLFGLCWYFLTGMKLSIPACIHSVRSLAISVGLFLKKEIGALAMNRGAGTEGEGGRSPPCPSPTGRRGAKDALFGEKVSVG